MPNKTKGNKNYTKGYELEQKLVNACKKQGFVYAQRTAGSHSVADVVSITPFGITILWQCKTTEKQLKRLTDYFKDDNVVKLLKLPDNIIKCLVIKEKFKGISIIHTYKYDGNTFVKINFKI